MAYYPRYALDISVPVAGTTAERMAQATEDGVVNWRMPLRSFRWQKNDHTEADVLEVVADWSSAGIDPRLITNATCLFFLEDAGQPFGWTPEDAGKPKFAGIMRKPARRLSGTDQTVSFLFHDYTALLIEETPFVTDGVPSYGMTLSQAWAHICDHVGPTINGTIKSALTALRDRIVFEGGASDLTLGAAVSSRFKKDHVAVKHPTDAWAVWKQCIGLHGLISFIRVDEIIVTTATDYFTEKTPARLIWGRNIAELDESRDTRRSQEGVIITSFDPLTASTREALWPPVGDEQVKRKHLGAKAKKNADHVLQAESRVAYEVYGVTDDAFLLEIAKSVWEVRSRQELIGHVVTHEFVVKDTDGNDFDLTQLNAGEVVRIEVEQQALAQLLGEASEEARVNILVAMGYAPGAALVLVRNLETYSSLGCKFFTKSVTVEDDGGHGSGFRISIEYCNRIQPTGDANAK